MKTWFITILTIILLSHSVSAETSWNEIRVYSHDGKAISILPTIGNEMAATGEFEPIFFRPASPQHLLLDTTSHQLSLLNTSKINSSSTVDDLVVTSFDHFPSFWQDDDGRRNQDSHLSGDDYRSFLSADQDLVYYFDEGDIYGFNLTSGTTEMVMNTTKVFTSWDISLDKIYPNRVIRCEFQHCIAESPPQDNYTQYYYSYYNLKTGYFIQLNAPDVAKTTGLSELRISQNGSYVLTSTDELRHDVTGAQFSVYLRNESQLELVSTITHEPSFDDIYYKVQLHGDYAWISSSKEGSINTKFRSYELSTGSFVDEFDVLVGRVYFFNTVVMGRHANFPYERPVESPTISNQNSETTIYSLSINFQTALVVITLIPLIRSYREK